MAGKFKKNSQDQPQVSFLVALDLLASGRFKFVEDEYNVSPMNK